MPLEGTVKLGLKRQSVHWSRNEFFSHDEWRLARGCRGVIFASVGATGSIAVSRRETNTHVPEKMLAVSHRDCGLLLSSIAGAVICIE